jgi:hypothetical protein
LLVISGLIVPILMVTFDCSILIFGVVSIFPIVELLPLPPKLRQSASIGWNSNILHSQVLVKDIQDGADADEELSGVWLQYLVMLNRSLLTDCGKDRIWQAAHTHSSSDGDAWKDNLAPRIRDALEYQQANPGEGVAVLVTGQVRTGTNADVVENLRSRVFEPLKRDGTVEIFAFLAFTTGGYHPWQQVGHISNIRDLSRDAVEQMLRGYGSTKFTLEESVGSNRRPDFQAEGCCDDAHPAVECANDNEVSEQWLKVHGALEMMKESEEERGRQFAHVLRIRPDVKLWERIRLHPPWGHNVPVVCSAGGGGADVVQAMPRWAAEAVDGMWRMTRDCPMPGVDDCRTKELVTYCAHLKDVGAELCGGLLWLGLWRQGVPVVGCGQGLTLVRPSHF